MKKAFLLFFLLNFNFCAFALTVITKSGETFEGTLLGENQTTLRLKDSAGGIRVFRKEDLDYARMTAQPELTNQQISQNNNSMPLPSINPADPTSPKPIEPKPVSGRLWSVQAVLSNSYDTNINHNEDDTDSYGLVYGAGVRWQSSVQEPAFKVHYEAAKHSYTNTDQWDRISQNLDGSYEWNFTKRISLDLDGEASFKGSSEDREIGNQYTFEPQLKYKLNKYNRFEFYGAYRLKRYEDDDARDATNRYLGAVYERRLFWKTSLAFEFRYEENDAQSAKHDYYRRRYGVSYLIPFRSRDWINIGFRYRQQNYNSRTVDIEIDNGPDLEFLRKDQRYNFNIDVAISLNPNLQLLPGYQYESRSSNDVSKEFTSHYPTLTLLYRWK